MAQEADWPKGFQMLQFLYKLITKESIWQLLVLHGSGARLAPGLSHASIPLPIHYNTKHLEASGASWLRTPIGPGTSDASVPLQIDYKTKHLEASGAS